MMLSPNFSLSELIKSDYAERNNIDNTPSPEIINNLTNLCVNILQPIRNTFGAVRVLSGYRNQALNKAVGGSKTSDHMKGTAADIECRHISNYNLACWIRDNMEFGQLILEFYTPGDPLSGWVHVSTGTNKQLLTAYRENGKTIYRVGLHQ